MGCAGGSVYVWLISTGNNNDVGEADKRRVDVEERSGGDAGPSADARVSTNVAERTDGHAESAASASVSIGNKHDLIDCDLYVVAASKFTLTLESIAPSRFNASEDAISSVSVDVTERFNCSSDIFCFFIADDEKKDVIVFCFELDFISSMLIYLRFSTLLFNIKDNSDVD
jgi:hypothetical protein